MLQRRHLSSPLQSPLRGRHATFYSAAGLIPVRPILVQLAPPLQPGLLPNRPPHRCWPKLVGAQQMQKTCSARVLRMQPPYAPPLAD
eukprot:scaffold125183_cov27-Tisochrysis_lutea.AAC.6